MIRDAKRPLAGPWRGQAEIVRGQYSKGEYDGITYAWKPNPNTPDGRPYLREVAEDVRGLPAVSVNMSAGRSGTRTFVDPADLRDLANELLEAAAWLGNAIVERKEGAQ